MSWVYYGGVDLSRSHKVHPEPKEEKDGENPKETKYKKVNMNSKSGGDSRGTYF